MIDRIIETAICYGMEMFVEESKVIRVNVELRYNRRLEYLTL